MVFQHLALFPMMNVAENIGYGLRCRGLPREEIARKVDAVLERIGLPGVGREAHRSTLRRPEAAHRHRPLHGPRADVLLLDEPLGALDLKLREQMKIELKQLQHQFGHHLRLHHPRPVGSAGHVGSGRGDECRPLRADRGAAGPLLCARHRIRRRVRRRQSTAGAAASLPSKAGKSPRRPLRACSWWRSPRGRGSRSGRRPTSSSGPRQWRCDPPTAAPMRRPAPTRSTGVLESLLFNGANSRAMVRTSQGDLVAVGLAADGEPARLHGRHAGGTQLRACADLGISRRRGRVMSLDVARVERRPAERNLSLLLVLAPFLLWVAADRHHAADRPAVAVVAREGGAAGLSPGSRQLWRAVRRERLRDGTAAHGGDVGAGHHADAADRLSRSPTTSPRSRAVARGPSCSWSACCRSGSASSCACSAG